MWKLPFVLFSETLGLVLCCLVDVTFCFNLIFAVQRLVLRTHLLIVEDVFFIFEPSHRCIDALMELDVHVSYRVLVQIIFFLLQLVLLFFRGL